MILMLFKFKKTKETIIEIINYLSMLQVPTRYMYTSNDFSSSGNTLFRLIKTNKCILVLYIFKYLMNYVLT